jgi:hypothetical protein
MWDVGGSGMASLPNMVADFRDNDPNYETYKHGQQFVIVDRAANQRNDSEISNV